MVEAAARILERDGLAGYTTNAVSERAGVSIGSLYQYFPHKDAITRALIEREAQAVACDVGEALAHADLGAALTGLVRVAVARQLERPTLAHLLDVEESRLSEAARPAAEIAAVRDTLAMRLAQALAGSDTDALAADIIAMVRTLCDAAGRRPGASADILAIRISGAVAGFVGATER